MSDTVAELPHSLAATPGTPECNRIDDLESQLAALPQVVMPVDHLFCEGAYIRTIHMPAGTFLTSKIHLTEHPFFILKGSASVWSEDKGLVRLTAPYVGITTPHTRRLLYIHEDCVWATVHRRDEHEDTVEQIESRIILKHDEHYRPLLEQQAEMLRQLTEGKS